MVSPWLPSLIRYRGTGRNVHQRRRYREECNEPCENPHCQGYARLYWDSAYRDHGNFPQKAHSVRQQRPKRLSVPAQWRGAAAPASALTSLIVLYTSIIDKQPGERWG